MGLKSMTGYGRALLREEGVECLVEILSVNRKHLDINLVLPRHLARFDPEIRKAVAAALIRGHVTVRVAVVFMGESPWLVRPNVALAKQLYQGWKEIAQALEADSAVSLAQLEKEPELFIYEDKPAQMEQLSALIRRAVDEALKPFMAMRQKEGGLLEQDIATRLQLLRSKMEQIRPHASAATDKYRQKLLDRMREVLPSLDTVDERLLKEVALFADKVDIEEEIVRFLSHLQQFQELLHSDQEAPGKTAEFLLQELGRETNTIGSKSSEFALTRLVVDIKAELERIREQIQNIE